MGSKERLQELEKELSATKYNKRTQHAIGLLKARIAKLKQDRIKKSSGGKKGEGYSVSKSGDTSAVLVGFPSVGKSTLLNALTNAQSEVGEYAFTTLKVIPGLLEYEDAKIQILDVPGILQGAAAGTGRGKEVLSVMRNSDLAIILIDPKYPAHKAVLVKEIEDTGLRLNQTKPDVKITKTGKGGIDVGATVKLTRLNEETIKGILREFHIINAQVVIREDIDADQLIDVIEGNRVYIPSLTIVNKSDLLKEEDKEKIKKKVKPDLFISADKKINLKRLKKKIHKKLNFIRIYTKEAGKKADMKEPLILQKGGRVREVCMKLHKDFVKKFKYAKIWGKSAKFPGQKKGLAHKIRDKDIVEVHLY